MKMKTLQTENGFTLIEALVAMVVLSIGIFSLYSMQLNGIRGNSKANALTTAATWNADQVEKVVGAQYSAATVKDVDGDGTGQDTNGDGIPDDGGQGRDTDGDGIPDDGVFFGLKDTVNGAGVVTADGSFTTADNRYILYWNVAKDVPMRNLKTIRVHVQDNSNRLSRPVTFTYIKADII